VAVAGYDNGVSELISHAWGGGCPAHRPRGARGEVVRAGVQEVAELASNLGALDFTTAGPPAADWDVYATVSKDRRVFTCLAQRSSASSPD